MVFKNTGLDSRLHQQKQRASHPAVAPRARGEPVHRLDVEPLHLRRSGERRIERDDGITNLNVVTVDEPTYVITVQTP